MPEQPTDIGPGPGDPRFAVPALPPRLVSRDRLIAALDHASGDGCLVCVTGGPGAGKTVLLSQWARGRAGRTAWLALTRADNDPVRFWPLFLQAAGAAEPVMLPSVGGGDVTVVLDAFFAEEGGEQAGVTIVLDDAHLLTDKTIIAGLDRVVSRWAGRVHLILAARSVPLLPFHKYRVAGQLSELRADDLAMNPGEARRLLTAHGVELPDHELHLLTERTEGWTAGLRLAAMRLEGVPAPEKVVLDLALDEGSIGEYLLLEVMARWPDDARQILIQTSFLDEVAGGSAEAVTGVDGCERILAELAHTNSFVVPVDATRTTFRCHGLLRDVLMYLARRDSRADVQARHVRACRWFLLEGDVASALRYAVGSGDPLFACSVLLEGLPQMYVDGQTLPGHELSALLDQLPTSATGTVDVNALVTARMVALAVGTDRAAAAAELEAGSWGNVLPMTASELSRLLAELMLARSVSDYEHANRVLDRLLSDAFRAQGQAVPGLRSRMLLDHSQVMFSAGRLSEVQPLLQRAAEEAEREGAHAIRLESSACWRSPPLLRRARACREPRCHGPRSCSGAIRTWPAPARWTWRSRGPPTCKPISRLWPKP